MTAPMTLLELRDAIAKAIADAIGHGMREKCERHADAVMAILDAEGDGWVAGDAKEYLDNCVNALDHIARTARNCRVTSKRLTWIASRAESAISGNDDWRDAPVPKNGTSALLRAQARIKELEAELPHPARSGGVSDADVDDAARYRFVRDNKDLNGLRITTWDAALNEPVYPSPKLADMQIDAARKGERHE